METLQTLRTFTEKYPQEENGKLQYSFLGGTAIRLHQEKIEHKEKRAISDFDLLVFDKNKNYPVHNCSTDNVFGVISSDNCKLEKYVTSTNLKGKKYFFMDGSFLALTKTCAIDNPREKDCMDVKFLYNAGLINFGELDNLYNQAERLVKKQGLSRQILESLLKNPSKGNIRLFQTFPRLVNLLGEFDDISNAFEIIACYTNEDADKTGYGLASVIYDAHSLLREFNELSEIERLDKLKEILNIAKDNDYVDFDRIVQNKLIPKARYSPRK